MKKFKIASGLFLIVFVILLGGFLSPNITHAEEKRIVTSFYPMYAITKEVVGDKHPVLMINSANGIHGFEPSANDVKAIYEADVFIYHSDILESWAKKIKKNLEQNPSSSVVIIEASNGLAMEKVAGLENLELMKGKNEETLYDPHTWLDPIELGNEAKLIADALSQIDPSNKDYYQSQAKELCQQAQALVDKYTPLFEKATQKTFVTQHTAFSYLANRFGLTQLGIAGVSGQEPSVQQLQAVKNFVDRYQVTTIFTEPLISDRAVQLIADETGANVLTLDPLEAAPQNNQPFLVNLEANLKILSQVLNSKGEN